MYEFSYIKFPLKSVAEHNYPEINYFWKKDISYTIARLALFLLSAIHLYQRPLSAPVLILICEWHILAAADRVNPNG